MNDSIPEGARPVARVLLLDASQRLLLLNAEHASDGYRFWLTPGGGLVAWNAVRALRRRLAGSYMKKQAWTLQSVLGSGLGDTFICGTGSGTTSTNDSLLRELTMIAFVRERRTATSSATGGGACKRFKFQPKNLRHGGSRNWETILFAASTRMSQSTVGFDYLLGGRPTKRWSRHPSRQSRLVSLAAQKTRGSARLIAKPVKLPAPCRLESCQFRSDTPDCDP